jgi:hypothetical protein
MKKRLFILFTVLIPTICWMMACKKNNATAADPTPLQHKWNLISYTATVPLYPNANFSGNFALGDYLDFRINDTVYALRSEYGQSGVDTATYSDNESSGLITAKEVSQAGLLFLQQDSEGHISTSVNIQIMAITDNLLVLNFPFRASVAGNGPVVYYPGTIIDTLRR